VKTAATVCAITSAAPVQARIIRKINVHFQETSAQSAMSPSTASLIFNSKQNRRKEHKLRTDKEGTKLQLQLMQRILYNSRFLIGLRTLKIEQCRSLLKRQSISRN